MKSWLGRTTDSERTSPEATSTNSSRTSVGVDDADDDGPTEALAVADAADLGAAWTRRAAIVLPSGDHQKLTTWPSRSVRVAPDLASTSRIGPTGIENCVVGTFVGPIVATVSPTGSNATAAIPKTGIVRSVDPSRAATMTSERPFAFARTNASNPRSRLTTADRKSPGPVNASETGLPSRPISPRKAFEPVPMWAS